MTILSSILIDAARTEVTNYLGVSRSLTSARYQPRETDSPLFQYKIVSSKNGVFTSKAPESIKYSIASKFSSLLQGPLGMMAGVNKVLQAASG